MSLVYVWLDYLGRLFFAISTLLLSLLTFYVCHSKRGVQVSSKCGYPGVRCEEGLRCQSNVNNVMWAEGSNGMNDG